MGAEIIQIIFRTASATGFASSQIDGVVAHDGLARGGAGRGCTPLMVPGHVGPCGSQNSVLVTVISSRFPL